MTSAGNTATDKDGKPTAHDVNYSNALCKISEDYLRNRIIVVGNADIDGKRDPSSAYLGNRVDVMAPGSNIYSTVPANYDNPKIRSSVPGYTYMSGTSMASPCVAGLAGLAGLLWEANPDLTPEEIKNIIVSTANIDIQDSDANMVNAEAAVKEALLLAGYDFDTNEVTFKFYDSNIANPRIKADSVSWECDAYDGKNPEYSASNLNGSFVVMNADENTTISEVKTTLPRGKFKMTFSAPGYQDETVEFRVYSDTKEIGVFMTPTGDTPPAPSGEYTLQIHFIDGETGETIHLTDLFAPDVDGMGEGKQYNNSYLSLYDGYIDDAHAGETPVFITGDFLNGANDDVTDGMFIKDDEIVFSGLAASEHYYLAFEASLNGYVLPHSPYQPWAGYFRVPQMIESANGLIPSPDKVVSGTVYLYKEKLLIGDIPVTEENANDILEDGSVIFDFTTYTLTLIDANISATNPVKYYGDHDLNILLPTGTSTVLACTRVLGDVINVNAGIKISGGGALYLKSNATFSGFASNNECGISANGDIRLSDLSITLGHANYGVYSKKDIQVENCEIDVDPYCPNTMFSAENITLTNCKIQNNLFNRHSRCFAIAEDSLNIYGNSTNIHVFCNTQAIFSDKINVNGGKILIAVYADDRPENGIIDYNLIGAISSINIASSLEIKNPVGGKVYYDSDAKMYTIRGEDNLSPLSILIQ